MTQTTTHDDRRTFRGPAQTGAPSLTTLSGVRRQESRPAQVLEIERYDTEDRRLAAAGIVLGVHRGPDEAAGWQLDLPDGDGRERLRVPLPPDAGVPPEVPSELAELVGGAARGRDVRPVGRVRTVRSTVRLLGTRGKILAEVARDDISLATLGRSTHVESWTELQLQLRGADAALAAEIEQRMVEAGLLPGAPAAEIELDRRLRPARRPTRGGGRGGSAGAVLLEYLAAQVDRLDAEELRVRRGAPDAVHQLRVAARRLRSALQAYRPLLDRARTDPLVDGLREAGRALAPARDAEVLREHISAGLADLEPELLLGPAQARVTRHFARLEAEAGAAVLSALDGDRYQQLRSALDDLLERPPLTERAARRARRELPRHVAKTARRLRRAVDVATDGSAPDADRDVAVHDARKAGKRLRYATEVARPAVGSRAKAFAKALKGFQSALGEHQDTVVARESLRELGALAHAAGENGFSFGVLHGRATARATRIEEDLPDLWSQAWTPRHRRWLR